MSWFVVVDLPWEGAFVRRFEREDEALTYYEEQSAFGEEYTQGVALIEGNLIKLEGSLEELKEEV